MASLFGLILILMTVASGVIFLCNKFIWHPARLILASKNYRSLDGDVSLVVQEPALINASGLIFKALLIVLVVRSFLVEVYHIPTESMEPNYSVNSSVLINKLQYNVREPLLFSKLIEISKPGRGDVVVFILPDNPSVSYIKRVVGLPGDEVTYQNKKLTVKSHTGYIENIQGKIDPSKQSRINSYYQQEGMKKGSWIVPDDHYFVIGDNRDNSQDSRFWGFVPHDNLVGKVVANW